MPVAVPYWQFQSLEELSLMLRGLPDPAIVVRPDGAIALANRQAAKLLGYRQVELEGEPLEILVPERFREKHTTARWNYFSHSAVRPMGSGLEFYVLRKDGRIHLKLADLSGITSGFAFAPLVYTKSATSTLSAEWMREPSDWAAD